MGRDNKKTAVLFPGQGSQYVGMGKEFLEIDGEASALLSQAEEVSGLPLKQLCLEGPMEELTRTLHLQPAVTLVNLICWQAVKRAGVEPAYFAGHSLGEYSALCGAAVLSPKDTMALVTERGRLMEREAARNPGGMRAVLGLTMDDVNSALNGLDGAVVKAANHNCETQIVISGEVGALDAAGKILADKGAKVIPLKVSGAWHSPLVADAVPDFETAMARAAFNPPQYPVIFNVTAGEEKDAAEIKNIMARQIASTVRWYDTISHMIDNNVRVFIEVGPKTVLSGLVKKIVPKGYEYECFQIDTPEKLERFLASY